VENGAQPRKEGRKDKRVKVLHIFGRISRKVITVK